MCKYKCISQNNHFNLHSFPLSFSSLLSIKSISENPFAVYWGENAGGGGGDISFLEDKKKKKKKREKEKKRKRKKEMRLGVRREGKWEKEGRRNLESKAGEV